MTRHKGIVYLVGAGPGDTGLMTVKGMRLLNEADVVVYDRLVNPGIIEQAAPDAQRIYVGKASSRHTLPQDKINKLLVRLARQGKTVVRLKGGDPFVFGRGGEEIELLVRHKILFEVVPGITSAIAVPAYAGIPVTHRGFTSSLGIFTGQEDPDKEDTSIAWDKISTGLGTLVFLMGVENLPKIVATLVKHGRSSQTPCCVIQWGTLPQQKSVTATLATIGPEVRKAGITPPAILVVGEVVGLKKKLDWFERRPLFGTRILVTLPAEDSSRLCSMLEPLGADCVSLPFIRIRPLADYSKLDRAIRNIDDFHWLVFTSRNGVRFFKERLDSLKKDVRALANVRIASIGPKTKEAIERLGIRVDVQPKDFRQEGLLAALAQERIKGKNILVVRAEDARDVLPKGLEKLGAGVCVVPAYRTELRSRKIGDRAFLSGFDAVAFTSSSCVQGFMRVFGRRAVHAKKNSFKVASIGPVTSAACRKSGLAVAIEAKEFTLEGLVQAIHAYYKRHGK
ncbi:MAG: uroporphyrinogen-III C-methyltransferase [Candidatus Omnitrophica bacterium]|nr:uroporphyrinogen-III C-methyltransferase [Candidatus Omnitrophota bacterium]